MSEFGSNKEFLQFLYLAKTDANVKAALGAGDHSPINNFPGISEKEKKALSVIDWNNVEIDVKHSDLTNFVAKGSFCTETAGPTFVSKRCKDI